MMRLLAATILLGLPVLHTWPGEASAQDTDQSDSIDFSRDIRPLLADRCFVCHGPDQSSELSSETELRLDSRESAIELGVFDFDDVESSEILVRILSTDESIQMPPTSSQKKRLTGDEVDAIRSWIKQGAGFDRHWAYVSPKKPAIPVVSRPDWQVHPVDAFVLNRLEASNLQTSDVADRPTLIRRLTFDLIGLPPTFEEIDQFVNDSDPLEKAVESVVDRLLASPHYGEHMARHWLDAARYADTSGYQYDRERTHWVWRDWVIHAFNTNKPFDEFTVEQIAGDLLPDATDQTRLATGFNRNHPITIEGGVIDEEYRTEYVIDRVVTTSTVWLGQTFLCARCHDHKYDPVSQKDFYQFFAYFNNVPEKGLNGFDPQQKIASPLAATRIQKIDERIVALRKKMIALNLPMGEWEKRLRSEIPAWNIPDLESVTSTGGATPTQQDDKSILMTETNPPKDDYEIIFKADQEIREIRLEAIPDPSLTNGSASRGSNGNFVLTEFIVEAMTSESNSEFEPIAIQHAHADYEQKGFTIDQAFDSKLGQNGWAVDGNLRAENRTAIFSLAKTIPAAATVRIKMLHRYGMSHQIGRFRLSLSGKESLPLATIGLLENTAERTVAQTDNLTILLALRFGDEPAKDAANDLANAINDLVAAEDFPATMVMQEMAKPRSTYVLQRGEYDKPIKGVQLGPAVPEAIGAMDAQAVSNRLGLAKWLVSRDQPLTARVTVNRFWQQLFGTGLVKTSEDFGAQGEYPSHPQLLDWLAVEFMDCGWDVKHLLKTIVMSRTYQQSSRLTPGKLQRDPENRMLARGPRVRLGAEAIRDNALAVSGLLDRTVGGPSVYPYHPSGLWMEINNRPNYSRPYPHQTDSAQHYRRTMYTFWKRTVTPPSAATFDAPTREYCVVRRSRTNTPLQAFVMLHDPQFVEASCFLARRMLEKGGASTRAGIEYGFRLCTSREPNQSELAILLEAYDRQFKRYSTDQQSAKRLLSVGVTDLSGEPDLAELAAMTQVARMLINLSEFLMKG